MTSFNTIKELTIMVVTKVLVKS